MTALWTEPDPLEIEKPALRAVKSLGIGMGFSAAGFFVKQYGRATVWTNVVPDYMQSDIGFAVWTDGEYFKFLFFLFFLFEHFRVSFLSGGRLELFPPCCYFHQIQVNSPLYRCGIV